MNLSKQDAVQMLTLAMQEMQDQIGPEATAQRVLTFLAIAANPGMPQYDMGKKVKGFTFATLSRNIAELSLIKRGSQPGSGLVVQMPDPKHRRRNLLRLTEKGEALVEAIAARMSAAASQQPATAALESIQ